MGIQVRREIDLDQAIRNIKLIGAVLDNERRGVEIPESGMRVVEHKLRETLHFFEDIRAARGKAKFERDAWDLALRTLAADLGRDI